ncbi:MAG: hypothetical protein HY747_00925 [Elusimicrobia bacterium]|nr:hypothetical protein [Elusimicrobiota bacterium]
MFAYFRGPVMRVSRPDKSGSCEVWIESGSVGYRLIAASSVARRLRLNEETRLFVSQSAALYGGETTLYGFLTEEDRSLFELLRDIPGVGAKKALDYFDKIQEKSPLGFLQGLVRGDAKLLGSFFGFTPKTAAKMLNSLKEKAEPLLQEFAVGAPYDREKEKRQEGDSGGPIIDAAVWERARDALVALGFDQRDSEKAVSLVLRGGENAGSRSLEAVVKDALRELSK